MDFVNPTTGFLPSEISVQLGVFWHVHMSRKFQRPQASASAQSSHVLDKGFPNTTPTQSWLHGDVGQMSTIAFNHNDKNSLNDIIDLANPNVVLSNRVV